MTHVSTIGQALTALAADQKSRQPARERFPASFDLETLAAAVGLDPDELLNSVKSFDDEFVVRDQR